MPSLCLPPDPHTLPTYSPFLRRKCSFKKTKPEEGGREKGEREKERERREREAEREGRESEAKKVSP